MVFVVSALFLLRDPSFLDEVPEEHKKDFIDSGKLAPYKLKILKKMIRDRFPVRINIFELLFLLCFQLFLLFFWSEVMILNNNSQIFGLGCVLKKHVIIGMVTWIFPASSGNSRNFLQNEETLSSRMVCK